MKKTGIYLGFDPGSNLTSEGIGRLLAFLLKENVKESQTIVIFSPAWLRESIQDLFKDNKISIDEFEVISTNSIPIGVKLKNLLKRKRNKQKKPSKMKQITKKITKKSINILKTLTTGFFATSSIFLLLFKALSYLLISMLLLPFGVMIGVLIIVYKCISVLKILLVSENGLRRNSLINKIVSLIKGAQTVIYQNVIDNELKKVVKLVNKHVDVSVCFIPSMIWPQIKEIKCNKIIAAPDIVFYDFPTQFPGVVGIHGRIRKSIEAADCLLCYSEYVKEHHLVNNAGVDPNKIFVVKHANVKMNEYLKIPQAIKNYISEQQNAQQIINNYVIEHYSNGHVLSNSNITDFDFIIYSSQCRPHKNITNLVKAIKIINKDMHKNVKLILTGEIERIASIPEYINDNNLANDIFVMRNLSSEVLAAFNKLAKCAVNPTLFEGGFPFTFSEAYSVGTPSVMSNIPVVYTEIQDSGLRDLMLFDPYNPHSIAQKIIWAIENRQELLEAQAELYQHFDQRDWKKVVGEYNQIFRKFMV